MKKLTFLLPLLLLTLGSCQLKKVMVMVNTPASLYLPPELHAFLVTSRYVPATGPYEDVQWGAYESVDSLKWQMAESIVDTIGKRMIRDNIYLVKTRHKPRMLRHNDSYLPDPLPWDGLLALAKKEFVQALLVLEGFDIQKSPVVVDGTGGVFNANFDVTVTLACRIYEPEKMRMLDDSVYIIKKNFRAEGKTGEEATSHLPGDTLALTEACATAADAYSAMIMPGGNLVKRYYYCKGDTSLVKVNRYVGEGKWGKAEANWKWLAYNSPDTTVQAKASFNMALMCERDGRLNQAAGFARRSERLHPARPARGYIKIIDGRIREIDDRISQGQIRKRW